MREIWPKVSNTNNINNFSLEKPTNEKRDKQTKSTTTTTKKQRKKIPLRGLSLHRYAVKRFPNNQISGRAARLASCLFILNVGTRVTASSVLIVTTRA